MLRLVLVSVAAGIIAFAAGCGDDGGGEMSLEEYLQEIEAQLQRADERSEAVFDDPDFVELATGSGELSDEDRDLIREVFGEIGDAFDDFLDEVESLDPPGDLQEEHDEFVAAYRSLQVQFEEEIVGRVGEAETIEDVDDSFAALVQIGERTSAACSALQQAADDAAITVSLNC